MSFRIIMACGLALGMAGCAVETRIALDPGVRQQIRQVTVANYITQDEVIVRANASGALAAGGLLGAMIESKVNETRQNNIQSAIGPFYATVDNYDFRAQYVATLRATLASELPLKFGTVESSGMAQRRDAAANRARTMADGSGLMTLQTNYMFSADYSRLLVYTTTVLYPAQSDKRAFLNSYVFVSNRVGSGGIDSLKAWSANNGQPYRSAANEASQQIMQMFKLDLAAGPADAPGLPSATIPSLGATQPALKGVVLSTVNGRALIRASNGNLYSFVN